MTQPSPPPQQLSFEQLFAVVVSVGGRTLTFRPKVL